MVVSNARKKNGFLHISFYKVVQIVLPIIKALLLALIHPSVLKMSLVISLRMLV